MLKHFAKLSPAEVVQFKKFVASPYFNTNRKVVLLTNYLSVRYPDLDDKVLNKKVIYRFVFRNQKYNDANFRKLNSDFNSVFKRFLTELEVEESSQLMNYLLLKRYDKFKIYEKIRQIHKQIIITEPNFFSKDLYYYISLFLSQYVYGKFAFNNTTKERMRIFENLYKFADFLIINLKVCLFELDNKNSYERPESSKLDFQYKKEIFELVEKHKKEIKKSHPNIFNEYCTIKLLEDESAFNEMEEYYMKHKKAMKAELIDGYMTCFYNYYLPKYQSLREPDITTRNFFRFLDDIFFKKKLLIEELFLDGIFQYSVFIMAVEISLQLNKPDWADKFIEKYKSFLPTAFYTDTINVTKAFVNFYKKNYVSVLKYLSNISGKSLQIQANAKFHKAMVYYETDEFEGIKNEITSINDLKKNKKISKEVSARISNFLKYFNMLVKIKKTDANKRREEILILNSKFENEKGQIPRKYWLGKKIEELEFDK